MKVTKYHCVFYDTLRFGFGEVLAPSYQLFCDDADDTNFVPVFDGEQETVKKYFNDKSSIYTFFEDVFGFVPKHYLYEKVRPFFENKTQGELDLILVNENIKKSIEIEFKRVIDKKEKEIYINNQKIKKVVEQANRSYNLGFHKVYAGIIIDVHGFKTKQPNIFYRNLSNPDLEKITQALYNNGLNENIGILIFEIVCTTEKQLDDQAGLIIGIYKEAKPQEQKSDISEKLARLLTTKPCTQKSQKK